MTILNPCLIIDGHNMAYRIWSTLNEDEKNPEWGRVWMGYFLSHLARYLETYHTRNVIVCWDTQRSFRYQLYPEYKLTRRSVIDPYRQHLHDQIAVMKEVLNQVGVVQLEYPHIEADDVLYGLAHLIPSLLNTSVKIVSNDKDLYQAIGDQVSILADLHKEITGYTLWELYGLTPDQWAQYRMLIGDSSDNIKGIKGVGPAKAKHILSTYGTIEEALYTPSDDDKVVAMIRTQSDQLTILNQLIDLRNTVSITMPLILDTLTHLTITRSPLMEVVAQYQLPELLSYPVWDRLNEEIEQWAKHHEIKDRHLNGK